MGVDLPAVLQNATAVSCTCLAMVSSATFNSKAIAEVHVSTATTRVLEYSGLKDEQLDVVKKLCWCICCAANSFRKSL